MATDSISANALHPEHRRFVELKARLADNKSLVRELEDVIEAHTPYDEGELLLNAAQRRDMAEGVLRWIEGAKIATDNDATNAPARAAEPEDANDEPNERAYGGDGSIELSEALDDLKALGDLLESGGENLYDGTVERCGAMVVERAKAASEAFERLDEQRPHSTLRGLRNLSGKIAAGGAA